jgi:hypothetical protein
MNPLLHRGKLLIPTVALACGGLAGSAAAHAQPGSPYQPPDPCLPGRQLPAARSRTGTRL